jgi:thiaminase
MPAPREPGDDQLPPPLDSAVPASPADGLIPAASFSAALAVGQAGLRARLRTNAWITAASGSLPPAALARWCQQRTFLVVHQFFALQCLEEFGPPATLAGQLHEMQEDLLRHGRQLAGLKDALGLPRRDPATISQGYGFYLHACADESLPAGLTALCTAAQAERHTWTAIPAETIAGTPLHACHTARTSRTTRRIIAGLTASLDEFATPGSHWQQQELEQIHQTVLEWENAWWDMCWHGTEGLA